MASVQVLPPPPRPTTSYVRKRRHSFSAPPPGFPLPFPQAPRPVSPLLTPSAVTAVAARRRVSNSPLTAHSRPATIGHSPSSRANAQRRLATYGEQGVAAASLATLEVASESTPESVKKVELNENSPLRKKQRSASLSALTPATSSTWNVRTFPLHRAKPNGDLPRRRLGIPSFGWPKPASAVPVTLATAVTPSSEACLFEIIGGSTSDSATPSPNRKSRKLTTIEECQDDDFSDRIVTSYCSDSERSPPNDNTANPRHGTLRCRSTANSCAPLPAIPYKPIPKPITKLSRRKSPSPPPATLPDPPRLSSPLGPERHILPPRQRFPRSMNSKGSNELKFGKNGMRIKSLGERGNAADLYKRVLIRNAHMEVRKREAARLASLADREEVYVLRLSDLAKGSLVVVAEKREEKNDVHMVNPEKQEEPSQEAQQEEFDEKMEVDEPECGDIELLPDIPDLEFDGDQV